MAPIVIEVFSTDERKKVEEKLTENGIKYEIRTGILNSTYVEVENSKFKELDALLNLEKTRVYCKRKIEV